MDGARTIRVSEITFIPDEQLLEQLLVDSLEETVGKGGVCACRLLTSTPSSSLHSSEAKLSADVEIKSAELASDLHKLAKEGLLMFWDAPLAVHLLQHNILSSPNVHNDRALTGPKSMQNSVASQSKFVGDIISQPKSMKNYIVPEPKSIREEIVSESKCKQCCILTEPKSMQKDISSGTKAPQKDIISSGLKSMQNETISGTKAPQKDILMSGLKSMHNEKDFMTSGSKSIHKDIISGINAPQKDVIISGSKSMQTFILPETKSTPKELLAGPQYMHNCTPTETKSMQKHSVSGPKSTQNYNIVVERKPAQKDTISLPRSRQNDSIQGPNSTQMSSFEGLNLHMGCQTSENTFFVSCSRTGVNAEFEFAIKRISLYLKECSREYKMVFTYGNIRYIHRGVVRDRDTQLLILRMRHAPRIYHMCSGSANDQMSKNFKKIQWVRTTDFTESCSIGHSSSLGLELSKGISVSQIQENFAHYKEIEDKVLLEHGSPFLSTSKLVPILKPPEGLHLPYSVIFKINSLVQNGILSWPTLGKEFFSLLQPERSHDALINQALEKLSNSGWNTCYRPAQWLQDQLKMVQKSNRHRSAGHTPLENGLMYVNSVQVTPAKIYFSGPEVNVSNRVLRHYADYTGNFLRVAFFDENLSPLHSNDLSRRMVHGVPQQHTKLYDRILHVLREGIVIGNKKFEFLAFSSSQLRESSLWMFASTDTLTADSIRKWMGNFWAIRNVAKCASRMGQSFSSSTETFDIRNEEFEYIHDVEVDRDGKQYVFSDGIGKISSSFAEQVARKCGCDNIVPSAFQIRFAGYKGMVAVDPRSSYKLSLRPSMRKYTSNNRSLDVLNWTKYRPCFLNRQIITLLSTLGVEGHHFQTLQKEAVELINQVLTSRDKALDVLQILYIGENHNVLTDMLSCGYCPRSEPYLSMMLQAFRASKFVELRNKARIFVPNGRCLMGCLDETRTLNYGEVFIRIRDAPGNKQQRSAGQDLPCIMVEGKVVVAKNPCLHPGDIRILLAVNTPKLQHMVDCIVFPQQGKRPHPSECSGSDLDGDVYFVSWDKSLIPPRQEPPMDYVAKPLKQLDREVTMEEIQEHFANYMVNDSLGVIANSHMAFADQEREMARSSKCLRLAELHSTAVDFAKTGVPVQVPVDLFPKKYPDFMEKEDKESYESTSILGKLYRYVTQADIARPNIAEKTYYDHELEVAGFDRYLDEASRYKSQYDSRLVTLMDHYGIRNEADIISGNIASLSNFVGSNKRKGDIRETVMSAVKSLKQEARRWFDSDTGKQFDKASAWYYVTYHPSYRGERNSHVPYDNSGHLISFPWVVHDILLRIKRRGHQATDYPESSAVRENRKSHSSFII